MNNKSGSEQDFCSCDIQMITGGVFEVSNMKPLTHSACGKPLRLHSVDAYKDHPFTNGVVQRQAEQIVRLQKLVEEASLQAKYKDIANARMDEIHRLQKLCEEQGREIEVYRGALGYAVTGDTPTKTHDGFVPVCGMCQARQNQIEEQKVEIARLKVYPTAHVYDEHNKKVRILQSQLATQTERVKKLEKVLNKVKNVYISNVGHTDEGTPHKHCEVCWIDQALNQESLGDGGNGEA